MGLSKPEPKSPDELIDFYKTKGKEIFKPEACYIDGGIIVNNPTLCAYAQAKKLGYSDDEIYLISIGTGTTTRPSLYADNILSCGLLEWIFDIFKIQNEQEATAETIMSNLLPEDHYIRLDCPLNGDVELGGISDDSIRLLENSYVEYRDQHSTKIDQAVALLDQAEQRKFSLSGSENGSSSATSRYRFYNNPNHNSQTSSYEGPHLGL